MSLSILGAGGHAKVALEAWRSAGSEVSAFYDDRADLRDTRVLGVRISGNIADGLASADQIHVAIGDNDVRARVAAYLDDRRCPVVIHSDARISPSAAIGAGSLVCAGAIVQAEARIGKHVIVNTHALVEHDARIGDYVHVAPGVRLGGAVRVGDGALIGIGAMVLPGVEIGRSAVIGAGAVVLHDVPAAAVFAGNPAHPIRTRRMELADLDLLRS